MSTLFVEELTTTLEQEMLLDKTKRYQVGCIYPHLIVYGNPAGTFTLELKRDATVVGSFSFTSSDIKTSFGTTDTYLHVFFPWTTGFILDGDTYTLKMSSSGYAFSESDYLGWCRFFEEMDYKGEYGEFNQSSLNPLEIRLKINEVPSV